MPQPCIAASSSPSTTVIASATVASIIPTTVALRTATRASAAATATRNTANAAPSVHAATRVASGCPNANPHASAAAPTTSSACAAPATSRAAGTGVPASTGRIWSMAPSITIAMYPRVTRCVPASAAGVARAWNASAPLHASSAAAANRNRGAVRKKRNGTEIGGACSSLRPGWCIATARSRNAAARSDPRRRMRR